MANPPPPFTLTDGERDHPLWLRLKGHLVERLESKRKANDQPLPEIETATLRGEIKQLRALIALGDPPLTGN